MHRMAMCGCMRVCNILLLVLGIFAILAYLTPTCDESLKNKLQILFITFTLAMHKNQFQRKSQGQVANIHFLPLAQYTGSERK